MEERRPLGRMETNDLSPPADETTEFASAAVEEDQRAKRGELPDTLPVLPLREIVVYPMVTAPLAVGQERSIRLVESASAADRLVALVTIKEPGVERGEPENVYTTGTAARIQQVVRLPDGTLRVLIQGLERIRTLEYVQREPFLVARVEEAPERVETSVDVEGLVRGLQGMFSRLVNLSPTLPDELATVALNVDDPRHLAYFIATHLRLETEQRQELLAMDSVKSKLEWLAGAMTHELQVLELGQRIQEETQERVSKQQRQYLLREQLRAIRKELGELDDEQAEIGELREKLDKTDLPPEARQEAERELARLERIPPASPEYGITRTYLDWLISLPWKRYSAEPIDVARARSILDEDHYDLQKVKERILEYLSVKKLTSERIPDETPTREPILCFVGPPGVGKTSLGQSIARATGRKFVRMSLGGVRDEAEIRGHRRTYVGALPGRFLQAIRRAGTSDPVIMLDEIDKIGQDWRGDPSSALLEVLDPEQNKEFRDHYVDVPFDLSKVMFITTANTLETIPAPLRDRMEILQLPGYTEEEKVQIARQFLVPRQRRAHGLSEEEVVFDDGAIRTIVRDYTREAGVRNLEREIASVMRKVAMAIAEGTASRVEVTTDKVREYLGRPKYYAEALERIDRPGVATGLVWTPVGGDIVFVEATAAPGRKTLKITGQLGDVMRESAEAALSYVRSQAEALGIDPRFFDRQDIHLHVPAGAVPKDGPSAGVTLMTALVSLLMRRPVRSDVAMTGEITLRGKVLPVGGIKEKVLGAHRAGIRTVILPKRNEQDLDELPADLREEMHFVLVDSADEVLAAALSATPGEVAHQSENALLDEPIGVAASG